MNWPGERYIYIYIIYYIRDLQLGVVIYGLIHVSLTISFPFFYFFFFLIIC
jgi:hypothetical protein